MQIHLEQNPVESLETDALVALTFEGQPNGRFKDSLSEIYGSGEVTGKMFEMTLVHQPAGLKSKRLLLAGAGPAEKFTSAELRRLSGAALRHLKSRSRARFRSCSMSPFSGAEHVEAAVEGALLGDYRAGPLQERQEGRENRGALHGRRTRRRREARCGHGTRPHRPPKRRT